MLGSHSRSQPAPSGTLSNLRSELDDLLVGLIKDGNATSSTVDMSCVSCAATGLVLGLPAGEVTTNSWWS